MLSRSKRFSRSTFPFKKPLKRATFSWGTVSLYPPELNVARVAVVVSKKTLRLAHDRNALRRRVYAAYAALSTPPPHSLVVLPRREALTTAFDDLVRDLGALGVS